MNIWWQTIRPKTLFASLSPVLLASALAYRAEMFDWTLCLVTLFCALTLQIAVNIANDLYDGLSGVDNEERVGPTRALHAGLVTQRQLTTALRLVVLLSTLSGCYLVYEGGVIFLFLGMLSLLGVYSYSAGPFPLASHALGETAVFLFFGLIAVLGSYYLQTQSLSLTALLYACIAGLHASAVMLVNNIRDIASDKKAGKITLAVCLGDKRARALFVFLIVMSLVLHCLIEHPSAISLWLPLVLALVLSTKLVVGIATATAQALNGVLAFTAMFGFVYAVSNSVSLLIG